VLVQDVDSTEVIPDEVDPGSNRLNAQISDSFYEGAVFSSQSVDAQANAYTGKKYTHASQFDGMQIVNGIDVSYYNAVTDWNQVKESGIDFVFVRSCYRAAVSGNLLNDTKYQEHLQGAIDAGLKVGSYIYSQATTVAEAEAEADYLMAHVADYNISMPLVLDYEFYSETGATKGRLYDANLSKEEMTEICNAFCARVASKGYYPMVYGNPSMFNNHMYAEQIADKYPIWLANYTTKTSYTGTYQFWQYNSTGSVPGITGNVDMNFWYTNDVAMFENHMMISNIQDQLYTGQPVTPEFTVSVDGVSLTPNVDYTYTITDNVEVGTATLLVTGIGNYASYSKTVTFAIVPDAVNNVAVRANAKKYITVAWDSVPGATGYRLYRADVVDGSYKLVKTVGSTICAYKDSGLTPGTEYYYYVEAVFSGGATLKSDVLSARTKCQTTRKLYLKSAANLKKSTASNASNVVSVKKKALLNILSETKNASGKVWYYVSYAKSGKTYYGYIAQSKGTLYRYAKTTATGVALRSGAGVSKKLVTRVKSKNKQVVVIGEKKDTAGARWYKVRLKKNGKTVTGYMFGQYLKFY
jgi:GH25 family lysozyme M1 (1,4-beta-N-acetylmuramidase)